MDYVLDFISFLNRHNIAVSNPAEIIADDKRRRLHLTGDKKGTKNCTYQLKTDLNYAVGWARSHKEGITHKYKSKGSKEFTPEERAEFRKKIDTEKKRKERELKKDYEEAAVKAKRIWDKAARTGESAYLKKKQADLNGARITRGVLIIPAYVDGKISSLQFIAPSGDKRFLSKGQVEGAYFPMTTAEEDKSVIILCEGFATGDAIRKATGLPVAVAFNASNLKPVAEVLRQKYPAAKFVIAADNDAFTTKPDGSPWNPGIEWARKAAIAAGGAAAVWPEFKDNANKYTDFNDALLHIGVDYVKERIISAVPNIQPDIGGGESESLRDLGLPSSTPYLDVPDWAVEEVPLEAYDEVTRQAISLYIPPNISTGDDSTWRQHLHFNEKTGKLSAKSLNNAKLFIENDKVLSRLFCFDDFSKDKIVYQCPPWESPKEFKPRTLNDTDITFLTCELEKRGVIQPTGTIAKLVNAVIKNNARNPAKEYFGRLVWDGVPRLDKWLAYYCGAEFDNAEYVSFVGRKWMTAAVARVFEPGKKFDHMLILEGPQNAGKSLLLKELATIHDVEYFDDTIKVSDLGSAATVPKLQGVLIVEIAEMAGLGKKDTNELKAEITVTSDRLVRKYENEATRYPRQFVFAGTINPLGGSGYLDDPTGNRRFWPVKVGRKIDFAALRNDKEQLWAEAYAAYKAGEKLYLNESQQVLAIEAQRQRNIIHPWYPDIEQLTRNKDTIAVKDIWDALGISDKTKRTGYAAKDISKIMTVLGFENRGDDDRAFRQRIDGKPQYVWRRKNDRVELDLDEEVLFG